MQDRCAPQSPSKVEDLVDNEMIVEDDIEEVIDLNDPIFESSSDENENPQTEDLIQEDNVDDAIRVFRGHKSRKKAFDLHTRPINMRDIRCLIFGDTSLHKYHSIFGCFPFSGRNQHKH